MDIKELLTGSTVFVRTDNTTYRVEKCAGDSGLRINVRVMKSINAQPNYLIEGFETEYTGMSNWRVSVLDGVLRVMPWKMNMGMAFEAHPSSKRTHCLTSRVLSISDIEIPGLENIDLSLRKK